MRRLPFLARLRDEGALKLVEPSAEIAGAYLEKARRSLVAARLLRDQELLEESTSMAYYAMYHAATSLLAQTGIKCENHAATIILLKELFAIDNQEISFAKRERVDKQYYTDFRTTRDEVDALISSAEGFIASIDAFTDALTDEKRKRYRDAFREAYLL